MCEALAKVQRELALKKQREAEAIAPQAHEEKPKAIEEATPDLSAFKQQASSHQGSGLQLSEEVRQKEVERRIDVLTRRLTVWVVNAGGGRGGIMVREGASLKSPEVRARLESGSLVRELRTKGDRLHYQLLQGQGPMSGWVSLRAAGVDLLVIERNNTERVQLLIRRLAMLPAAFGEVLAFDMRENQEMTQKLHQHKGVLDQLSIDVDGQGEWRRHAAAETGFQPSLTYPAFHPDDPVLVSLLQDSSLTPLRCVFPRPAQTAEGDEDSLPPTFVRALTVADGLLPDAMGVAYFLGEGGETLQGAVRFGPQASQSVNRQHPDREPDAEGKVIDEEGEFFPGVHGGASASVLYDAALCLARLSWKANCVLKKIKCQFSKPCPCFRTLSIVATMGNEGLTDDHPGWADIRSKWEVATSPSGLQPDTSFLVYCHGNKERHNLSLIDARILTVKVSIRSDKDVIASAEVQFDSFPELPVRLPKGLPRTCNIAPPCTDWVPQELARARLPESSVPPLQGGGVAEYLRAAVQDKHVMQFPRSCAAVEDITRAEEMRREGCPRHVRSNRPVSGRGAVRNDLCFPEGLAPAASSHVKYFVKNVDYDGHGIGTILTSSKFEGTVKFGAQASEACFLDENGCFDGNLSTVAHFGLPLAVLDDAMAHLPRCTEAPGATVTWRLEMQVQGLVPIGHELDYTIYCSAGQDSPLGHSVQSQLCYEGETLVTASAIIASS
eukprot:TRINITY_DN24961_c0_g2_i1.p1 TRINITY_DN24961_c0_g2~~TRINITY_DN24961_c0_g2_i1.p1  ORF type:complete len:725 (-),score=125.60 TRINITY_DN24961_c0_g2_i1:33-2207(-)